MLALRMLLDSGCNIACWSGLPLQLRLLYLQMVRRRRLRWEGFALILQMLLARLQLW